MISIVFIDSRVNAYQALIDALEPGEMYYLIDPQANGVSQLAAVLERYTSLEAIHVVSHGSEGTLYLGSTVLSNQNLLTYGAELATIGASLTDRGDILLYGCNVGAGETGCSS